MVRRRRSEFITKYAFCKRQLPNAKRKYYIPPFSELLRYLARLCLSMYSPVTLLWWPSGQKQFGNKWIRTCKDFREKMYFVTPRLYTLHKMYPSPSSFVCGYLSGGQT